MIKYNLFHTSGTIPPVYRSVYPSSIHLLMTSRYGAFSPAALKLPGAKILPEG